MERRVPWVIFDADNTLWYVECLYDLARKELCRYVASLEISPEKAEEFQQQRDQELVETYGYSACRFARSFEDTLLHLQPASCPECVRHARMLALEVFEKKADAADGLEELLDKLACYYQLGIITAGERWVQERRLNDFHLRDRFAAIDIVESKTETVFRAFCERHRTDPGCSWVVGDSLRSDIEPARAAGIQGVFLNIHNWEHENQGRRVPEGIPVITRLRDLATAIGLD